MTARVGLFSLIACLACSADQGYPRDALVIDLPPAEWTLLERQFSRVLSVRELSDTKLLVSDGIENELYGVDVRSGEVLEIGTHGEGPLEYNQAGFLYALDGDSTLFTDDSGYLRWLLVVGERIVAAFTGSEQLVGRLNPDLAGVDRFGRALGLEGFAYAPDIILQSRIYADSVRALLTTGSVFEGTSTVDTVAEFGGAGRLGVKEQLGPGPSYSLVISPLASEGYAWLFPDGWIAIAHPDPYRVDWRLPDGNWIRGTPLPFVQLPVDRKEKCFALSRHDRSSGPCQPSASPGWPKFVPPFVLNMNRTTPSGTPLGPAPNGMLLIRRTATSGLLGTRYDIVNRSGGLQGVMRLPIDMAIVGVGRHSVYVVQRDDFDRLTLSRHRWPVLLERTSALAAGRQICFVCAGSCPSKAEQDSLCVAKCPGTTKSTGCGNTPCADSAEAKHTWYCS